MEDLLRWTHRHLLWLILAASVLGAIGSKPGLWIRGVTVGTVPWPGGSATVSLPMLMLGVLLVVAGLGTRTEQLRQLARRPWFVVAGLIVNTIFPLVFTMGASLLLMAWHNTDEAQNILVGLALIGAMPIAGSSTAWSQNANGNVALSLGLVLGSTLLSPLLTPLGLHAVGFLTHGDYSKDLHALAARGSSAFIMLAVVIPSAFGLVLRALVGARRVQRLLPVLKLFNLFNLIMLNYSNAAAALPQVLRDPDWDFLAVSVFVTTAMCAGAFAAGWFLPRGFDADRSERTAMMFGMGMNNNGTGLVLASTALAGRPLVMLPLILYNLVQQIVAGIINSSSRSG